MQPMPSQQTLTKTIQATLPTLQASLDRGWQQFHQSETFTLTSELYQRLDWWYDSPYYGKIPNPPHWYAAQLLANEFLLEIGKLGLYFGTVFPGDFAQSVEFETAEGLEVRRFKLPAFHRGVPVCTFQLDFIHQHQRFYFLRSPQLSILGRTPCAPTSVHNRRKMI